MSDVTVPAVCSWTKWRSSNTAAALRTPSTQSTTPGPAPPLLETTSGDTCRSTPLPSSCSSSLKWLHLVGPSSKLALCHHFLSYLLLSASFKVVRTSHYCGYNWIIVLLHVRHIRSPHHLHPRWGGCRSEPHVLYWGSLQSGCKCHELLRSWTIVYI